MAYVRHSDEFAHWLARVAKSLIWNSKDGLGDSVNDNDFLSDLKAGLSPYIRDERGGFARGC